MVLPVQYIEGRSRFRGMDLVVNKDVLIPRPETEGLVEAVLSPFTLHPSPNLKVLDLCTGSGNIAISLAPKWRERAFAVHWFLANSKGVLADGLDSNTGWASEATVASVVEQTCWTVEMAVPLKAFGVKADDLWGQVWGCRLERSRYAGGSHEASAWTRLVNAKMAKGQWGHVIFKGVRPPKKEPPTPPAPKGGPANPE